MSSCRRCIVARRRNYHICVCRCMSVCHVMVCACSCLCWCVTLCLLYNLFSLPVLLSALSVLDVYIRFDYLTIRGLVAVTVSNITYTRRRICLMACCCLRTHTHQRNVYGHSRERTHTCTPPPGHANTTHTSPWLPSTFEQACIQKIHTGNNRQEERRPTHSPKSTHTHITYTDTLAHRLTHRNLSFTMLDTKQRSGRGNAGDRCVPNVLVRMCTIDASAPPLRPHKGKPPREQSARRALIYVHTYCYGMHVL
eukprot:GHVQ01028087.1.p1 GENE.GHVQ01028087.1~~GHVQ01028087.1.p1  ORF type:complete len:253 (-),score=17.25 GHVQ01028087.1:511-1269(-)